MRNAMSRQLAFASMIAIAASAACALMAPVTASGMDNAQTHHRLMAMFDRAPAFLR
jgi:hypothetical protein